MQVRCDARARMNLDALARVDRPLERPVDRDALDAHLCVDLRGVAEDELAAGRDRAFEFSVDAESLLEGELALEAAAFVEKSIEGRSVSAGFHGDDSLEFTATGSS